MNKEEREIINKLYSDVTSFDVPCMPDITISRRYLKIILSLCLKQQETIDKVNHILSNQMDYWDYIDVINDIEDVLNEVSK